MRPLKSNLVTVREAGLYCEAGDFYVDPWLPVERAVLTHAHGDHARVGSRSYLAAQPGERLLRRRLPDSSLQFAAYGERIRLGAVHISLHPAGHILGSAQIRIEHRGEVWVVSGDYKLQPDPTCSPIEPLPCHTFITESTFALPIYRWRHPAEVLQEINQWWHSNKDSGKASILYCYALGKAQRILSGLDTSIGPIYTHGSVETLTADYRKSGVHLPPTVYVGSLPKKTNFKGSLILAPPSAQGAPWLRQFGSLSTAFASGWMRIRGTRRRRSIDRGFVLSDHADWPGLMEIIGETGAQQVIVTHGNVAVMVRWLKELGIESYSFQTRYEGEVDDESDVISEGGSDDASADGSDENNLIARDGSADAGSGEVP